MNRTQEPKGIDVDAKCKEAGIYYSMGLLEESLNVYQQLLSGIPELAPEVRDDLIKRVGRISREIARQDDEEGVEKLSPEEVALLRETLAIEEDIPSILSSFSAFKELGLFKEAISEYEKLFRLDFPPEKVVPELLECLFKIYSPPQILEHVEKITGENNLINQEKAQIKFMVGLEMEKRGHKDLASDLFESAISLDPSREDVKAKKAALLASLSYGSRYDYLLGQEVVTKEQLQEALALSKKKRGSLEHILIDHFKIKKDLIGKSLSYFYGCPFKVYDPETPIPVELVSNLKKPFLLNELWVPLSWGKEGIDVLIDDPRDLAKTDHIRRLLRAKKLNFCVAIKEDIEAYIKRYFSEVTTEEAPSAEDVVEEFDSFPDVAFEEEEEPEQEEELTEASGQIVRLVDQVLIAAYRRSASDIHVEPSPITKATRIRFRVDGVCQDYLNVPNSMAKGILSRLKILSGLDIAERRLPQDGKIKFKRKGIPSFELRMATLPTAGGYEDAVLRILAKAGAMELDSMGLSERNLGVMKEIISRPYGLVLVVGPTGSGKTTTLHSSLGYINKPGIKIWTAEDPVEITQAGLRQVEAKPKIGLDFARILRAFLRADPDVIMIGEMRDEETASIGVEASLTGHLVFSTLHTNSAPETVTRLLDMGLNPLNFSDAFLGVLAQRLVRRLCTDCRKSYRPTEEEFGEIVSDYGEAAFGNTGIEYGPDLVLYAPEGCEKCSGSGYRGRLGVHELMEGTPEIKRLIKKQASTETLFAQATKEGMATLKQDGINKVFQGLTDISEIRRVCIN